MRRFWGGMLLAAGILMMTLSGLCSVVWLVSILGEAHGGSDIGGVLGLTLLIGGVPFGAGFGFVIAGRNLLRKPSAPKPDELADRFR